MTRIAGDSTTLGNVPDAADVVLYYVNGLYAATEAGVAKRYPGKVLVGIDVNATSPDKGAVLDVEKGDATPADAPGWLQKRRKAVPDGPATVYCNRSTLPEVEAACTAAKLTVAKDYLLFVATLDGTLYTGPGVALCQVWDFGSYDLSVIWDDGWHPAPNTVKASLTADLKAVMAAAAGLAVSIGKLSG